MHLVLLFCLSHFYCCAGYRYADCLFAECRYDECRGAIKKTPAFKWYNDGFASDFDNCKNAKFPFIYKN
jgi:hypothetical protein